MDSFPQASETKAYTIENQEGVWLKVKYAEAKNNPNAIRARKGSVISWFIREEDLAPVEEVANDQPSKDKETA